MKRLIALISTCALTATAALATDDATWGQVKNDQIQTEQSIDAAAKKGGANNLAYGYSNSSRTVSAVFGPAGGRLNIFDKGRKGTKDNMNVIFDVFPGALDAPVEITMTVQGNTLSELVVVFAPAGLEFLIPASLAIGLGDNLIDASTEGLRVEHVHADGRVDGDVLLLHSDNGAMDSIWAEVPGFSRYSVGGGW